LIEEFNSLSLISADFYFNFFPKILAGILMSEGEKWRTLRNFAIQTLKAEDFLHAVQRETVEMISVLKVDHCKSFDSRKK
jgi:hypothetical protein